VSHHCHAEGCDVAVHPKLFACKRHWYMLPPRLRALIWKYYEPGQEVRKDPSPMYLMVQAIAVAWLAKHEGEWTDAEALEHCKRRYLFVEAFLNEEQRKLFFRLGLE